MSNFVDDRPNDAKFHRDTSPTAQYPRLKCGLYTGVVIGALAPNQLAMVQPDADFNAIPCIWAASILSGLLGFKTTYLPPIKTRVIFFYNGDQFGYILGSYSSAVSMGFKRAALDPSGEPAGNLDAHKTMRPDSSRVQDDHAAPFDLAEGEIQIDNLMGVGVTLLRHLASLQAGDLARVECSLFDDMVRIISRTFKHHSAFGDFKIVNDGGHLNVEWHGTSHDNEAWGNLGPTVPKAYLQPDGKTVDLSKVQGYTDDGRWRFSQYIGWLGDFINMFVTDPVQSLGKLAAGHYRSGKARMHVNNDGTVLIQSVTDIVLEKVVRIPVPVRIRREEDPTGDRSDGSPRAPSNLDQWDPSNADNPFEMAFQLREYARWLNNMHSLSRFRQLNRDFEVPTEKDTPIPAMDGYEQDKEQENEGVDNTRLAYACFRIYRDGSLQTVDAYGNSILTTKKGIQISSTSDILIQAAGSVNIQAGRDINLVAHDDIGITAVMKKLRLAAGTGIHTLISKVGSFLIQMLPGSNVNISGGGGLNVGGLASISGTSGEINSSTFVIAAEVQSAASMTEGGDDPHPGHMFPGVPSVDPITEIFQFPETYDGITPDSPLYQTYAQSTLNRHEQPSDLTELPLYVPWVMSENIMAGGYPWPGASALEWQAKGGQDLNHASATPASAEPQPLIPSAVIIMRKQVL